MTQDQAIAIRDFLAANLEQEAQTTRKVLEAVPATGNDYRPDPKSRTGFELAWHIASADAWFLDSILNGEFKMSGEGDAKPPAEVRSPKDIVSYYDQSYVAKLVKLKALTGEQLTRITDFLGAFKMPLLVYISWLGNHSIHHRGQLCAYLRPMGSKVPCIYGGSADEPFKMPS